MVYYFFTITSPSQLIVVLPPKHNSFPSSLPHTFQWYEVIWASLIFGVDYSTLSMTPLAVLAGTQEVVYGVENWHIYGLPPIHLYCMGSSTSKDAQYSSLLTTVCHVNSLCRVVCGSFTPLVSMCG